MDDQGGSAMGRRGLAALWDDGPGTVRRLMELMAERVSPLGLFDRGHPCAGCYARDTPRASQPAEHWFIARPSRAKTCLSEGSRTPPSSSATARRRRWSWPWSRGIGSRAKSWTGSAGSSMRHEKGRGLDPGSESKHFRGLLRNVV